MAYVLSLAALVAIIGAAAGVSYRKAVLVQSWQSGLLYWDGAFVQVLSAGRHVLWGDPKRRQVALMPRNLQIHTSGPVDVLSADRFAYRLTASLTFTITDPRKAYEDQYAQRLRLAVNDALATLASERTLEAMLGDRADLPAKILERAAVATPDLALDQAVIGPLQLPPETRRLFTNVERAKLEAQATLERARGEQAALRSLANAARMLKDNPDLMNLRLLQALGAKGTTLVLNQGGPGPWTPGPPST
jgi:regulator of protease activity HflC (stomatin/prohibitin superfamily)